MSLANYFSITLAFTIFYTVLFAILAFRGLFKKKTVSQEMNDARKEVSQKISTQQQSLQDCFSVVCLDDHEDKAKGLVEKGQDCLDGVCQLINLHHAPALKMIPNQILHLCEANLEIIKDMTAHHKTEVKKQVEKAIAAFETSNQSSGQLALDADETAEASTDVEKTNTTEPLEDSDTETPSPEEVEEQLFQYEALIEQLRHEKSQYANRIEILTNLLGSIQSASEKWAEKPLEKPMAKMSEKELAAFFEVELDESHS